MHSTVSRKRSRCRKYIESRVQTKIKKSTEKNKRTVSISVSGARRVRCSYVCDFVVGLCCSPKIADLFHPAIVKGQTSPLPPPNKHGMADIAFCKLALASLLWVLKCAHPYISTAVFVSNWWGCLITSWSDTVWSPDHTNASFWWGKILQKSYGMNTFRLNWLYVVCCQCNMELTLIVPFASGHFNFCPASIVLIYVHIYCS